ncbi:MAG: VOC family protein [Nitrospinales bacterium]
MDANKYIEALCIDYLKSSISASRVVEHIKQAGVGWFQLVDHVTFRTDNVEKKANEIARFGYEKVETLEFQNWWGNIYSVQGSPLIFIDQSYEGEKGKGSLIKGWVDEFGDQIFHHIAIHVEDIESSVEFFKSKLDIEFSSDIMGQPNADLRQIFTKPEIKNGKAFSVLELIERNNGYRGLLPPQADKLMESTRL